jgi:VWFA-related protein
MRCAAFIAFLLLGWAGAAAAQQTETPPVFSRDIELVKVDVVVSDKSGNPVTGLKQEDFTVLDQGQPQAINSFEVVNVRDQPVGGAPATSRPKVASNMGPKGPPGRSFVVVFDNLHMTPLGAQRAKTAVAAFLDKGLYPGDRVTLAATGGGAWWSTRMPEGRTDLVALLKALDGRRSLESTRDRLLDFEAMRIFLYNDTIIAARVSERINKFGGQSRADASNAQQQRAQDSGSFQTTIDPYVSLRAAETYLKARTRSRVALSALERVLKALTSGTDRKAVLLISEGFVLDPEEEGFKAVSEAARRANAAIYFVDTRGLEGLSTLYGVEFGSPISAQDTMSAIADVSQEGEGSELVASETGGFTVKNTNDLAGGIERITRESRSYYVASFAPANLLRDGKYHKIEVKVRGHGLVVRARRGYYAPGDGPATAKAAKPAKNDEEMQEAIDSPFFMDGLPLRMTAYVLEEQSLGRARTLFVTEADVSNIDYHDVQGQLAGALDSLIVVAHRDSEEIARNDARLDIQLKAGAVRGGPVPYSFTREFGLAPGGYQAKIVLRDVASRRTGTVSYDFDVPPLEGFRVSTPILTDAIQSSGGAVAPVVIARRSFKQGATLYCRFDVYGATTSKTAPKPNVTASHVLRKADGTVMSQSPPSSIAPTSLGALSRMMAIPLADLPPGAYDLVLVVRDQQAAKSQELVEPFTIE